MRRIITTVALVATTFGGLVAIAPAASAARRLPSCTVNVSGSGTTSATIDAAAVNVPKGGSSMLSVFFNDGTTTSTTNTTFVDAISTTYTVPGNGAASCIILDRRQNSVFDSGQTMFTVVAPAPAYTCAVSAVADQAAAITYIDWSVTVQNDAGATYAVDVDVPGGSFYQGQHSGSSSGSIAAGADFTGQAVTVRATNVADGSQLCTDSVVV